MNDNTKTVLSTLTLIAVGSWLASIFPWLWLVYIGGAAYYWLKNHV